MTEPSRPRRPALLTRESWARRIARAREIRLSTYRNRGLLWRLLAPAVFISAGALFVTSAVSSDGTDLRAGRYGDLSSVVSQTGQEVRDLTAERDRLAEEVRSLSAELGQGTRGQVTEKIEELEVGAGLAGMRGPGLTVELDDASSQAIEESGQKPDYLIVHQQDIQAVVNAMWAGGAEAVTIQGQRVITTTGIKCVGSTVILHEVPYAPPYVITAVGDPAEMLASIESTVAIDTYLDYVASYGLGWDVLVHDEVELPPYTGSIELSYARPADEV